MQQIIVLLIDNGLKLKWMSGYRTTLAAVGLILAGVSKFFVDPVDVNGGVGMIFAALAALGIRHAEPSNNQ